MSVFRYLKARHLILTNASELIDKFEKEIAETGDYTISCKQDLMEHIRKEVASDKDVFSRSKCTHANLIEFSMWMVSNSSYRLFEGHTYRVMGAVNWSGAARNAFQVHEKMIKYAVDHGLLSQEAADENALALKEVIHERL